MTTISLIGLVLTIAFFFIKRALEKKDDPKTQHQKRYARIDADIAAGDSAQATANADADLDAFERYQRVSEREGDRR